MLYDNCMIQVARRVKCICMNENNFGGCMLQITLITVHLPHYTVHIVPCAIANITGIQGKKENGVT